MGILVGFSSLGDPQKWLSELRLTFGMTDFFVADFMYVGGVIMGLKCGHISGFF